MSTCADSHFSPTSSTQTIFTTIFPSNPFSYFMGHFYSYFQNGEVREPPTPHTPLSTISLCFSYNYHFIIRCRTTVHFCSQWASVRTHTTRQSSIILKYTESNTLSRAPFPYTHMHMHMHMHMYTNTHTHKHTHTHAHTHIHSDLIFITSFGFRQEENCPR